MQKMIEDLSKLIAYRSVLDTPSANAPFGKVTKDALDFVLGRASDFGLQTINKDKYGYCQYSSDDKDAEIVGSLCHLDIVPEGELDKWDSDPFVLTIKDGIMYGRGVADNKGSAIAVLYALKRLKDNGVKLKRHARLILGCNEETHMECVKAYVQAETMPICSFVPDSDFPVINSEKGIMQVDIIVPLQGVTQQLELVGGFRPNMIPESCSTTIRVDSPLHKYLSQLEGKLPKIDQASDFDMQKVNGQFVINAKGISGHAKSPHKGSNAILKMFAMLSALRVGVDEFDKTEVFYKLHTLFVNQDIKQKVGLMQEDPDSGKLTVNPGVAKIVDGNLCLTVDARLPKTVSDKAYQDILVAGFEQVGLKDAKISVLEYKPNLFIQQDSQLIKTLLSVYKKHTGQEGYCIKSGGGTYARMLNNAVAFGATFPNTKTEIHSPNEQYPLADFKKIVDIYYDTFLELCNKL